MDEMQQAREALARILEIRRRQGGLTPSQKAALDQEHDQLYGKYGGPYRSLGYALQLTPYGVCGEVGDWQVFIIVANNGFDVHCHRQSKKIDKHMRTKEELVKLLLGLDGWKDRELQLAAATWFIYLGDITGRLPY